MIRMLNCNICLNLSSIYILHTYLVLLWPLVLFAATDGGSLALTLNFP
jgi:hypothetical protein